MNDRLKIEGSHGEYLPPRALSIEAAARYAGVIPWTIQEAIWTGKLTARRCGRFVVILIEDLDRYLKSLPIIGPSLAPSMVKRRQTRDLAAREKAAA